MPWGCAREVSNRWTPRPLGITGGHVSTYVTFVVWNYKKQKCLMLVFPSCIGMPTSCWSMLPRWASQFAFPLRVLEVMLCYCPLAVGPLLLAVRCHSWLILPRNLQPEPWARSLPSAREQSRGVNNNRPADGWHRNTLRRQLLIGCLSLMTFDIC